MRPLVLLLATLLAYPAYATGHHNSNYCYSCPRDSHGHIKRSPEARNEFKQSHPIPQSDIMALTALFVMVT